MDACCLPVEVKSSFYNEWFLVWFQEAGSGSAWKWSICHWNHLHGQGDLSGGWSNLRATGSRMWPQGNVERLQESLVFPEMRESAIVCGLRHMRSAVHVCTWSIWHSPQIILTLEVQRMWTYALHMVTDIGAGASRPFLRADDAKGRCLQFAASPMLYPNHCKNIHLPVLVASHSLTFCIGQTSTISVV